MFGNEFLIALTFLVAAVAALRWSSIVTIANWTGTVAGSTKQLIKPIFFGGAALGLVWYWGALSEFVAGLATNMGIDISNVPGWVVPSFVAGGILYILNRKGWKIPSIGDIFLSFVLLLIVSFSLSIVAVIADVLTNGRVGGAIDTGIEVVTDGPCVLSPEADGCEEYRARQAEDQVRLFQNTPEETRRQAEIPAAAEQARIAAQPVPQRVLGTPCSTEVGRYTELGPENECRTVTFGQNEKYYFEGKEDFCPRANPTSAGRWVSLGGDQYDFIPHNAGVTVTFFYIAAGDTFLGSSC